MPREKTVELFGGILIFTFQAFKASTWPASLLVNFLPVPS